MLFSGYSDMVIGIGKLLGIGAKKNFNLPYLSRDIAEFWKRLNISLNTWFVEYVYVPLGDSRVPKYSLASVLRESVLHLRMISTTPIIN